jgi:CheY-like chemotaxis protein
VPRVLVIDDEEMERYLVAKLLTALPADVLTARAGAEGLRYARERRVDIIVLDIVMPDSSGFQVISDLQADPATRDIPVVIHTSMTLGAAEREALAHARAIISKSRTEPELCETVKLLVGGLWRTVGEI